MEGSHEARTYCVPTVPNRKCLALSVVKIYRGDNIYKGHMTQKPLIFALYSLSYETVLAGSPVSDKL